MKLADSSEYLDSLKAFANSYGSGGYIWVGGGNGCTLLKIPLGFTTYTKSVNQACHLDYIPFCEYDSKAEKLVLRVKDFIKNNFRIFACTSHSDSKT